MKAVIMISLDALKRQVENFQGQSKSKSKYRGTPEGDMQGQN